MLLKQQDIPVTVIPLILKEFDYYELETFCDYKSLFNNIYGQLKYSLEDNKEKVSKLNFLNREKKKLFKKNTKYRRYSKNAEEV